MRSVAGGTFCSSLAKSTLQDCRQEEILSRDLMVQELTDAQEAARFKEWEMPVNQFTGFHTDLPRLVDDLSFDTVKDYDDYISRLKKVPSRLLSEHDEHTAWHG